MAAPPGSPTSSIAGADAFAMLAVKSGMKHALAARSDSEGRVATPRFDSRRRVQGARRSLQSSSPGRAAAGATPNCSVHSGGATRDSEERAVF